MVQPVKGSGIGAVDDFYTRDFMTRLGRMANPVPRDYNLRPLTTLEKVSRANPRESGLKPFSDMYQGIGGFIPRNFGIPKFTGDADTVGGQLLQGLGNLGIDALEGLRIVGGLPVAAAATLGTESDAAYRRRMQELADDPRKPGAGIPDFVGGSLAPSMGIDEPTSIVGGPSYQQTPTDPDQDAAIRSQIADAQAISADNPLGVDVDEITGAITPADIIDDGRMPGTGVPDFVGGVPAALAKAAAAQKSVDDTREEGGGFSKADADQGLVFSGQGGAGTAGGGKAVEGADNSVKQSTVAAIDDVLRQVKPDAKPKDYDDYMKEFAELTGLDVSGQPDNSQALMAFGLALMQNKAGKGFNVGRMLSEVGAAGEKAMPALAAARKEAKTTRIKAAEFAISRKDKDEAQMLNRQQYFVLPKDGKGFASNINKAESTYLNPLELNAMVTDKAFTDQFELIPGSQFNAIRKEAMKGTELGDQYRDKPEMVPLLAGAKDLLKVPVFYESPNYKGPRTGVSYVPQDAAKRALGEINMMNANLNRAEDELTELVTTINNEGVTIFDQTQDGLVSFGRSIGVDFGKPGQLTSSQKISLIFDRIQARYAPQILQEAGKTISDADRQRVEQIVGGLEFVTTKEQLTDKIRRIHEDIIGLGRANVRQAYDNLQGMTDYDISRLMPRTQTRASQTLNKDERKELEALRKKQGIT